MVRGKVSKKRVSRKKVSKRRVSKRRSKRNSKRNSKRRVSRKKVSKRRVSRKKVSKRRSRRRSLKKQRGGEDEKIKICALQTDSDWRKKCKEGDFVRSTEWSNEFGQLKHDPQKGLAYCPIINDETEASSWKTRTEVKEIMNNRTICGEPINNE